MPRNLRDIVLVTVGGAAITAAGIAFLLNPDRILYSPDAGGLPRQNVENKAMGQTYIPSATASREDGSLHNEIESVRTVDLYDSRTGKTRKIMVYDVKPMIEPDSGIFYKLPTPQPTD